MSTEQSRLINTIGINLLRGISAVALALFLLIANDVKDQMRIIVNKMEVMSGDLNSMKGSLQTVDVQLRNHDHEIDRLERTKLDRPQQ